MKLIFFSFMLMLSQSCTSQEYRKQAPNEFAKSLNKEFPDYSIKTKKPFDFSWMLFNSCSKDNNKRNYVIKANLDMFLIKDSICISDFYYEIVEFNDSKQMEELINLIENNNCLDESWTRVMAYKKVSNREILLCNYSGIDWIKIKTSLNNVFSGSAVVDISTIKHKGSYAPQRQ